MIVSLSGLPGPTLSPGATNLAVTRADHPKELGEAMSGAPMIGGVFLLARVTGSLAEWYERHLGWHFQYMAEDDTYYVEVYYREPGNPEQPRHLVYAIMPGDPGEAGRGHIVNYRVDDIEGVVASLQAEGTETSGITVGPDADGQGRFARLQDPEGHRIELWEHLGDR